MVFPKAAAHERKVPHREAQLHRRAALASSAVQAANEPETGKRGLAELRCDVVGRREPATWRPRERRKREAGLRPALERGDPPRPRRMDGRVAAAP